MKRADQDKEPLWRDEFSIETTTESYVARRQFAKFLVLTSLGMFVGNIWIVVRNWFAPKPTFQPQSLGSMANLGIGEVKLFSYPTDDAPCILIRTTNDDFVAYSQKCTHLSCAVYFAKEANRIECPCHEGYFSVTDGSVLQGPPPRRLPRVLVERDGDEVIAMGIEL